MLHEFQNMRKDDCNEVWNTMTMLAMPYADEDCRYTIYRARPNIYHATFLYIVVDFPRTRW